MDSNLWYEFIVYVELPHLPGHKVPMCGLCANTGIVDTRQSARTIVGNIPAGIRNPCICPNGRAINNGKNGQ